MLRPSHKSIKITDFGSSFLQYNCYRLQNCITIYPVSCISQQSLHKNIPPPPRKYLKLLFDMEKYINKLLNVFEK